jgi:signal transduction histidine kinase
MVMPSSGTVVAMRRPPPGRRVAIREFLAALSSPDTFNLRRNIYILFGFLLGLPIPVFSIAIDLLASGRPFGWDEVPLAFSRHPIHWFFALHPLFFAIVFGAMGAVRLQKNKQIVRLVDALESKVRALGDANAQLKDLDRMKSEFLANVSHELRTPLVCISGYTEMLSQGRLGETTPEQREALTVMARNIERLIHLIEELLELGRMESNRTQFVVAVFDLADVVRAAGASLQPILRQGAHPLVLDGLSEPVPTMGDRDKIFRVLVNLLANACKVTPKGKQIGVRLTAGTREVEVEVWDEGPGLTEEDLHHIFQRFWQGGDPQVRGTDGSGLGLAIVKEILDRHDTRIYAANRVNGGAQFRFKLRRVVEDEASSKALPAATTSSRPS